MELRPEYKKVLDELTWAYPINGMVSVHHYFERAIGNCQSLADRPRVQLTDAEICEVANAMPNGFDGYLKDWGWRQYAREIIKAEHAKQIAPVMQKITVYIFQRKNDGAIKSSDSPDTNDYWTLIDTITKEYEIK